MTNGRQRQGSFREPVDELVERLLETEEAPAPKASTKPGKDGKHGARCPAFHNQALFKHSGR